MSDDSTLLLTGATGFVGRYLTRRLLDESRRVIALARSRGHATAAERVARAVGVAPDGDRSDVVDGDLERWAFGVVTATAARLCSQVTTVVHCAGDSTFFPDDLAAFRASHVEGPLALLRELADGRLQRWVQVSTAFVCGRRSGTVLESEGDVGQGFHNPYERLKLESEMALKVEGARLGVDVRVFRPAVVVGEAPETLGGTPSSRFFDFIRLVAALGARSKTAPRTRIQARPRAPFNIVPVEDVARVIAALAEHPCAAGATCHVVVPEPPTQDTMLALIAERLGVRELRLVEDGAGPLRDLSRQERAIARVVRGYREYLGQDVRFDDATARRLLRLAGQPAPSLDARAVHRLIDLALVGSR